MTNEDFIRSVKNGHSRSINLLDAKVIDYASIGVDRLSQFKKMEKMLNINSVLVVVTLAAKHFSSISDMANDPLSWTIDTWREKTTDLRNYTHLLDALLEELNSEASVG